MYDIIQTLYVQKGNPKKQIDHAFDNEIPLIIFLGEDELKKGIVKLKVYNNLIQILYEHE